MNEEEVRIAIAESVGWYWKLPKDGGLWGVWNPERWTGSYAHFIDGLPNYPNDLNAMHTVWGALDRKERIAFSRALREVVVKDGGHAASFNEDIVACVENATARQRAEAYLRTKGLWKD